MKIQFKKISTIQIFIVLEFTIFMFTFSKDQWDGTLIANAIELRNFNGIYYDFTSQQIWLGMIISYILFKISILFNLNYYLIYKITALVFFILLYSNLKKYLNYKSTENYNVTVFILTFPALVVFSSSIMLSGLICLVLGLAGCLNYIKTTKLISFTLIPIIISFEYNVMTIINIFLIANQIMKGKLGGKNAIHKVTLVAFLSSTYLIFHNVIMKPLNEYSGYNQIQLNLSFYSVKVLAKNILEFSTFLLPVTALILYLIINLLRANNLKVIWRFVIFGTLNFLAAILPFIAVGKATSIFDLDWTLRYALPLIIIIPVVLNFLLELSAKSIKLNKQIINNLVIFAILINSVFLVASMRERVLTQNLESHVIDLISAKLKDNEKIIRIITPYKGLSIRNYESTYMASRIDSRYNYFKIDNKSKSNQDFRVEVGNLFKKNENQLLAMNINKLDPKAIACEITLNENEVKSKKCFNVANLAHIITD